MTFEEMLEKVADEELRKSMKEEFTRVNKEAGERGRKLIEKDGEINTLKTEKKQKTEWESAFKILKDSGHEPQDIPDILEKMKVTKTIEDEHKILVVLARESQDKVKTLEKQVKDNRIRTAVDGVFAEVRKNFKDDKGKALVVIDDFIDKAKLYADISDPENKVLLEQRAKEVLTGGLQAQEAIKVKFGFQGATTHVVPEGGTQPGGETNIAAQLKKTAQEAGPTVALSEYYKLTQVNT